MPDLVLDEREQQSLRALIAEEPVHGRQVLSREFLENLATLIPCDALGACVALDAGPAIGGLEVRTRHYEYVADDLPEEGAPLYLGTIQWSRSPPQAQAGQAILPCHVDGLTVGFCSGPDAVAHVCLERRRRPFAERDVAMLNLLLPVFQRHLRQQTTTRLAASLTMQERRVLMEVAAGASNTEVAATLCVAPSTVRKHLEHAFRKLGVTNRLAAVVALEGGTARQERRERIARCGR